MLSLGEEAVGCFSVYFGEIYVRQGGDIFLVPKFRMKHEGFHFMVQIVR